MRAALLAASTLLAACQVDPGWERRISSSASDEPSSGRAVLADGAVEYEVTAWHLGTGTHLDTTIRNRGSGVLRVDPARLRLVTAAGDALAETPAGCGACRDGEPCPQVAAATAVREVAAGGEVRIVRCFATANAWEGRAALSGADPKKLRLTLRDEGLALGGAPLVAVVELARP